MRIACLIIFLIVTNTTYSGFSGTGGIGSSWSDDQPPDNQSAVVDVNLPLATSSVDSRQLEASLSRAAGQLAGSYKRLIDAGCSTLETSARINVRRLSLVTTTLPVDLSVPVSGSYFKPVALRLKIALDLSQRDEDSLPSLTDTALDGLQNQLVAVEFVEAKPWVKEFASVPYIPLPSLNTPVHEEPMTKVLHQVVCIFFSAALLLATIRDYQLTSALLENHQNEQAKLKKKRTIAH